MFNEDAVSLEAAPEYSRGVVVIRPVLGELLPLATSAVSLRDALNTGAPALAMTQQLSFRDADESLADEAGARP